MANVLGVTGGRETKGDSVPLYVVVLNSCVLPLKSDLPFEEKGVKVDTNQTIVK